jgi:predicted N-acetyltransferase YhbS
MSGIVYARDQNLSVDDYVAAIGDTALGRSRPIGDRSRIQRMLAGANFIVTARENGDCVGVARCVTDFAWVCFCSELGVRTSHQGRGIGTEIVRTCVALLGEEVAFNLFSRPASASYYEQLGASLGMKRHADAFSIPRVRGA